MKAASFSKLIALLPLGVSICGAALADSGSEHDRMMRHEAASEQEPQLATVDDIAKEVMALRQRVAALEALKPTFTNFMPNFAERFHVAHRAGDAGDWALAAHEVDEMQRMMSVSTAIDAKLGALMQAFLAGNLAELEEAIEHRSPKAFRARLQETLTSCDGCHVASGSTLAVTLEVDDSLSMRHPHALRKTAVPKTHMHGH